MLNLIERVAEVVGGRKPQSFRDRMTLQMEVVERLTGEVAQSQLATAELVAPAFAQVVAHV